MKWNCTWMDHKSKVHFHPCAIQQANLVLANTPCSSIVFPILAGNTALTYACAGGFLDVVKVLLKEGANIEDHNENGHTPLMEAASAGHVDVARVLLEYGAGINTHSNEFKESALTLACYKGASHCIIVCV